MTDKYPRRSARSFVFCIVFFLLQTACKRTEQPDEALNNEETYADTSATPMETAIEEPDTEQTYTPPERHEVIDYPGYWQTIQDPSNDFQPFAQLRALALKFIFGSDSLRAAGDDVREKQENLVYAAIMKYKSDIESGKYFQDTTSLLDLPRTLGAKDSSSFFLPQQQTSFFTNEKFFFIGGAPFIDQHNEYDTATHQQIIFKDANGKPERRFKFTNTENRYHLLKSVMQFRRPRVKIKFGGPVFIEDLPAIDVKGIGSVIHNFIDEIPVFFLTESGIVRGRFKYHQETFLREHSCYSEETYFIFSCPTDIEQDQILGIYIPYDDIIPTTFAVSRTDKRSWSADLNNDTVPDIVCVIDRDDPNGILEMIWFVNVNGTWRAIEYGIIPICS